MIVGFILLAVTLLELYNRVESLTRQNAKREQAQTQVAALELTKQDLNTRIAYATSEAAVEKWAREEGHLAKPGEVPIVPIPAEKPTASLQKVSTPTPVHLENWQIWVALFFGK